MNEDRLGELLDRYVDERLTPAEKAELEAAVVASPAARAAFWARLHFEGALEEVVDSQRANEWLVAAQRGAPPAPLVPAAPLVRERTTLWMQWTRFMSANPLITALGAAAVIILAFVAHRATTPPPLVEPTSSGVAVLTSLWNVRWPDSQPSLSTGSILSPSRIRFASGVMGIEFFNGVRMTLEGPADIELVHVDEVLCHAGKMRVQVPHVARHFRVRTGQLDVLDLGTEFALDASIDAATEVHVFDGKVAWAEAGPASASPKEELVAGQAIRKNPDGLSRIAARPDEFVSGGLLEQRMSEQQQARLHSWTVASQRIGRDPRTLLHYDFARDPVAPRTVRNRAVNTGNALDGIVVGSNWAEGRWRGKGAMDFKHHGDRVRVVIPGEYDALTFVTWLRVQTLERMFTSIFLTDGFEAGEPHWQFFEGQIRLGIGDTERRKPTRYLSPRVWLGPSGVNYTTEEFSFAARTDRWIQLAVVMDTERQEVAHYVDGRRVSADPMVIPQKLRIGDAELGNWGLPASTDPQPIRNFHGTMDQFTIYRVALSTDEIATLFDEGRPLPGPVHVADRR